MGTRRGVRRTGRRPVDVGRLRVALAGLTLPRGSDRQLLIALDVTPWPRPDAECSPGRLTCHRPCRCDGVRQTIPGWPYQVAAALGGGVPLCVWSRSRTSRFVWSRVGPSRRGVHG
ncbi:transposase [Streptomyces sp. NBC_01077]|uniref:transposase n=1 Tax=Streptomyces sp. NBC_01077 TaxID=2903746 RepID=UPI00386F3FA0